MKRVISIIITVFMLLNLSAFALTSEDANYTWFAHSNVDFTQAEEGYGVFSFTDDGLAADKGKFTAGYVEDNLVLSRSEGGSAALDIVNINFEGYNSNTTSTQHYIEFNVTLNQETSGNAFYFNMRSGTSACGQIAIAKTTFSFSGTTSSSQRFLSYARTDGDPIKVGLLYNSAEKTITVYVNDVKAGVGYYKNTNVSGITSSTEGYINKNWIGVPDKVELRVPAAFTGDITVSSITSSELVDKDSADSVEADASELDYEKIGLDSANPEVTDSITLPTTLTRGTTVTWESSNTSVIANDGTVTLPSDEDVNVVLKATITGDGGLKKIKYFPVTVKYFSITDEDKFNWDFASLTYSMLTEEEPDIITQRLTLPTTLNYGSTVTWETTDDKVITTDGGVTRYSDSRTVTLTAYVTYGAYSDTKEFIFTVAEDEWQLEYELNFVDLNGNVGTNYEITTGWDSNLFDVTEVQDGIKITKISEETTSTIASGAYPMLKASLPVALLSGTYRFEYVYEANITASNSYFAWRKSGNEALSANVGKSTISLVQNQTKPVTSSEKGSSRSYERDVKATNETFAFDTVIDDLYITNIYLNGNKVNEFTPCYYRKYNADRIADFYAYLNMKTNLGDYIIIKSVRAYKQNTEEFDSDRELLNYEYLTSEEPDLITSDLNLSTTLPGGSQVIWTTSDAGVIDISGNVTRSNEDKFVMLTAEIKKGIFSEIKTFEFLVLAENKLENNISLDRSNFQNGKGNWLLVRNGGNADAENGKLVLGRTNSSGEVSATKYFVTDSDATKFIATGENVIVEMQLNAQNDVKEAAAVIYSEVDEKLAEVRIKKQANNSHAYEFDYKNSNGEIMTLTQPYTPGDEGLIRFSINTHTGLLKIYDLSTEIAPDTSKYVLGDGGVSWISATVKPNTIIGGNSVSDSNGVLYIDNVALLIETVNKDAAIVELEKANLKFSDISAQSENGVTDMLNLLYRGKLGANISWISSKTDVISNIGSVTRSEVNRTVELTATITYGNAVDSKTFILIVPGMGDSGNLAVQKTVYTSSQASSFAKENAIDANTVTSWKTNGAEDEVSLTVDLGSAQYVNKVILFEAESDNGGNYVVKSFDILVSEDNITFEKVASGDTVGASKAISFDKRNARFIKYLVTDKLSGNSGLNEMEIYFIPSDAEAVVLDAEATKVSGEYSIADDVEFLAECKYGSTVTWLSSSPDILSNEGKIVERPKKDTVVTLTATFTKGSTSHSVSFVKLVKKDVSSGSSSSSGGGRGGSSLTNSGVISMVSDGSQQQAQTGSEFTDVAQDRWSYQYIVRLNKAGVILGYGDGGFKPNQAVLREEFAKMLVTAFELDDKEQEVSFGDVSNESWYAKYVNTAAQYGIINGRDDGNFGVGEYISRQDMAVMLVRAAQSAAINLENGEEKIPQDAESISEYAKSAVLMLMKAGVLSGNEENRFMPADSLSREQAAKVICEMLDRK